MSVLGGLRVGPVQEQLRLPVSERVYRNQQFMYVLRSSYTPAEVADLAYIQEVQTCEMDGTYDDQYGVEHYWTCDSPATELIRVAGEHGGVVKLHLCEDHAAEYEEG
jgi:hypothetical protein